MVPTLRTIAESCVHISDQLIRQQCTQTRPMCLLHTFQQSRDQMTFSFLDLTYDPSFATKPTGNEVALNKLMRCFFGPLHRLKEDLMQFGHNQQALMRVARAGECNLPRLYMLDSVGLLSKDCSEYKHMSIREGPRSRRL